MTRGGRYSSSTSIEANGDFVSETTAVVGPDAPGPRRVRQVWRNDQREVRTFVDGVERPEPPEGQARFRNRPVRPQPHLALNAYGVDFLHQGDVGNAQAHAAGRPAGRTKEAADCSGRRCRKVTFTRTQEKDAPDTYRTLPERPRGTRRRRSSSSIPPPGRSTGGGNTSTTPWSTTSRSRPSPTGRGLDHDSPRDRPR